MNTYSSQNFESYVPVYDAIPEKWEDAVPFLVEQLKLHGNAINIREIGWFLNEEVLSGKSFIPANTSTSSDTQEYRSIFRKIINFGALPNTASKSIAHGINISNNFTLLQLYGAATDPIGLTSISLPYVDATVANSVSLSMDATNITVVTHDNKSAYTRCYVIIEYIQEM